MHWQEMGGSGQHTNPRHQDMSIISAPGGQPQSLDDRNEHSWFLQVSRVMLLTMDARNLFSAAMFQSRSEQSDALAVMHLGGSALPLFFLACSIKPSRIRR